MAMRTEFLPLAAEEVAQLAAERKRDGWRFVQILAVNTENGVDVQYSFQKDDLVQNFTVAGVKSDQVLPSITGEFFSAFVFENEVHDLFGVAIEGMVIDFGGKFYHVAKDAPMTIISPAQLAAREKAAKLAAAQKAKEAKAAKEAQEVQGAAESAPAADDLEAKLAGMDPEKAAKVRAAMEAKAKKAAAAAERQGE